MTPDRFSALAAAYGSDLHRWPAAERSAATAFAAAHPEIAADALFAEHVLDGKLDAYEVAAGATLRGRIVASAPLARTAAQTWRWVAAAGLGLGLAASCAAGVAVGFTLAPADLTRALSGPAAPSADETSALADPAGDAGNG